MLDPEHEVLTNLNQNLDINEVKWSLSPYICICLFYFHKAKLAETREIATVVLSLPLSPGSHGLIAIGGSGQQSGKKGHRLSEKLTDLQTRWLLSP